MANSVLAADKLRNLQSNLILTFIVPAGEGCNLKCSYCIIEQRGEVAGQTLGPFDYASFIEGVAAAEAIGSVAIQGHEPLLPGSLPYTAAILAAARRSGVPATLVTNGVYLIAVLPMLCEAAPDRIGVSLDAAAAERHDKLRGVPGAFAATIQGLEAAVARFSGSATRLTVISTLMPRRVDYLTDMPRLLRRLGVVDWIVNPLLTIGENQPGRFAAAPEQLLDDLETLQFCALGEGVTLTIDDEFDLLRPKLRGVAQSRYAALNIETLPPDAKVLRLLPSGHCSTGREILHKLPPDAPFWRSDAEDAAAFLRRLSPAVLGASQAA